MAIVSVFSGSYCHGEEIAGLAAEKLGLEFVDDKLIEETTKRFDIPKEKLLRAIHGPAPFWNNFTHEREKNVACLRVALADILSSDGKILCGYASHLIPDNIPHALRVCVIANFPYRVERAQKVAGKTVRDAEKLVHKDDAERLQWTQFLFDEGPYEEKLYDLVIPMQDKSIEEAVQLICDTAQSEPVRTTPLSQLAVRDAKLAAEVHLALVNANHDVDVTARHGDVTISINRHVMRMKPYQEELKRLAQKVSGVSGVQVQLGAKYRAPAINPMANVELPPKILLVDDEKEFIETLSERLQTRDLTPTIAYGGEEAIDLVDKDQPDVMVLDLMMPGIGGIETLRRIKRSHPKIEVIILTGHGSENEEQLAAELGAFAYLQKPVNIDRLAQVMRDAYRKVNEAREES